MTEHEGLEHEVEVDGEVGQVPPADGPAGDPTPATTGHPAVDEVLRSLDALAGRPVEEHVAAFEDAHASLRRALSHAGDDTA